MKNIILSIIIIIAICSCSSNDDNEKTTQNSPILENKLVGSWKLIGYYDDIGDDSITGTNYHLVENGGVRTFNSDGTIEFPAYPSNPIGDFSVSTDSVLTMLMNENYTWNPNSSYGYKINLLTEEHFETSPYPMGGAVAWVERYKKITNP